MTFEIRLVALGLVLAAVAVTWALLRLRSRRFRRLGAADLLTGDSGRWLVLAFSTPDCVPCRTIQKPSLEELQRRYPDRIEVRDVDAIESPDLARRFGILTVPSTVVVDDDGVVHAINHGLAGWQKLADQLHLNGDQPPARESAASE